MVIGVLKSNSSIQEIAKILASILPILFGILLASIGIKGFLLPNHFIDGGVMGTSMLISDIAHFDLALIILLVNTPFVLIGGRQIGLKFAIRSALAILVLSIVIHFATFPILTSDKLLSAIFGGLAVGAGIGFAFRGGAVLDGTEILAIILSKRFGIKVGDVILIFNVIIFSVAGFFLGLESALYSVLTYVAASKAIDFLVYGFDFLGVNIISNNSNKIREAIMSKLELGITIYRGRRGHTEEEQEILFCVCSRLDVPKIKTIVTELDNSAFVTVHKITDSYGGVLKRPRHLYL